MSRHRLRPALLHNSIRSVKRVPTETLTIQPDETSAIDTFVQEAQPSNAATSSATVAVNAAAGSRRHALLKFDLSPLAGKTLVSARLVLCNTTTSTSNQDFYAYAILAANSGWVEGATWQYAVPSTTRWAGDVGANAGTDAGCSVPGVDYNSVPLGTATYIADSPDGSEISFDLDVSQMQNMVSNNYGIVIQRSISGIFSMHSSSSSTASLRPKLVVEYR